MAEVSSYEVKWAKKHEKRVANEFRNFEKRGRNQNFIIQIGYEDQILPWGKKNFNVKNRTLLSKKTH